MEFIFIQLNVLHQKYYTQRRPDGPKMTQAACAGLLHMGGILPWKTWQRCLSLTKHPNPEALTQASTLIATIPL